MLEQLLPLLRAYWPIALTIAITAYLIRNYTYNGLQKYPGPMVARFTDWWRFWLVWKRRPDIAHLALHRQHGSIIRLGPNTLSFSSPAAVKQIYGLNKGMTKSGFYPVQQATSAGKRLPSLFSTTDEVFHANMRKCVSNAFSMSALVQYEPLVNEVLDMFLNRTRELYASTGESINFPRWLQFYAFDVIGKITYSQDHGFVAKNEDIEGMVSKLHAIFDYAAPIGQQPWLDLLLMKNPILLFLDKLGFGMAAFPVAAFAKRRMAERKDKPAAIETGVGRADLLTMFLKAQADRPAFFTDERVLTLCGSMAFAGSDTTSISLSAIFYYLLQNPTCYQKLVDEIETAAKEGRIESRPNRSVSFAESQQLPYLDAVVNESFRCCPAPGLTLERITPPQGIEIDSHWIPGGTIVGCSPWVIHKQSEIFDPENRFDVDSFIPERWLDSSKEQINQMKAHMLHFGAGSRTCIGKNISLLEIYKTIPSFLRRFEVSLAQPGKQWKLKNSWFVRQEDFNVKVRAIP